MKKNSLFYFVISLFSIILFSSCNTKEGEGGSSSIEGKIYLVQHADDNYNLEIDTICAAKTDVFIIYGNDDYFGDDIETDDKGFFRFKYLTPGNYTVFAYSTLSTGEQIAVSQSVKLKRGENAVLKDMYVHEGKAYGTSMIKGRVHATYIHNGYVEGEGWAYEHRVYIRRVGEPFHFNDERVGIDGVFMFQKILPGEYEIFTVTEDENEIPSIIMQTITVTETGAIIELPEIFNVTINV